MRRRIFQDQGASCLLACMLTVPGCNIEETRKREKKCFPPFNAVNAGQYWEIFAAFFSRKRRSLVLLVNIERKKTAPRPFFFSLGLERYRRSLSQLLKTIEWPGINSVHQRELEKERKEDRLFTRTFLLTQSGFGVV